MTGRGKRPTALPAALSSAFVSSPAGPPLTPRTPHSRAGRAEEGYTSIDVDREDTAYESFADQQRAPLLPSASSSTTFPPGYHVKLEDDDEGLGVGAIRDGKPVSILAALGNNIGLIIGCIAAAFLLVMIYIAFRQPETLAAYILDVDLNTPPHNASTTISYANYTRFPLAPLEYATECAKLTGGFEPDGGYWDGKKDVVHSTFEPRTCASTITYMLDGYVGLFADLALLAQAAGLARESNRTLFIDDTNWNRGKWTDHFRDVREMQLGPEPGCVPPPSEELVACPRSARHWVINSRTAVYHFGSAFEHTFTNGYAHSVNRLKPIYTRAHDTFRHTIQPNTHNAELIRFARAELASMLPEPTAPFVSAQMRMGDRKGKAWTHRKAPVPVAEYADALVGAWARRYPSSSDAMAVYAASDDPGALDDLRDLLPADTTFLSLPDSAVRKLQELASPRAYVQREFAAMSEEERVRLTRGAIVDFAMVSRMWGGDEGEGDALAGWGVPEAIACGIASNMCKMAALGPGWDRAFGDMGAMGSINREMGVWLDVDLKGSVAPEWEAFEMF